MDSSDPRSLLENMADGSFTKVVEKNNKMIFIETKTEKVKNSVLREFVEQAKNDGFSDADLLKIVLGMDQAVEENRVRNTLKKYL